MADHEKTPEQKPVTSTQIPLQQNQQKTDVAGKPAQDAPMKGDPAKTTDAAKPADTGAQKPA